MGVVSYKNVCRIYLDMDGVVADYDQACLDNGVTPKLYKRLAGAFIDLSPIEGCDVAVRFFDSIGFDVWFLTKPPTNNIYAASEKLAWINKYFPEHIGKVIITCDKGCVGTQKDYLIDDHPEWANASNFPGTVIKFDTDWMTFLRKFAADYGFEDQLVEFIGDDE